MVPREPLAFRPSGLSRKRVGAASCFLLAAASLVKTPPAFLASPASRSGAGWEAPSLADARLAAARLPSPRLTGATRAQGSSAAAVAAAAASLAALVALAAEGGRRRSHARRTAVTARAAFGAGVGAGAPPAQLPLAGATASAVSPLAGAEDGERSVAMHLLMPKNVKYRKPHKPVIRPFHHCTKWKFRGFATKGNKPHFGKYALQALEEAWINNRTIEAIRRTLVQTMERKGKVWIRIFPHQPVTERTAESRMGAGKGNLEYWVQAVRPGFILFEMDGVEENVARNAMRKAATKLPCKSRFLKKADGPSMFELGLAGLAQKDKRAKQFNRDPRKKE